MSLKNIVATSLFTMFSLCATSQEKDSIYAKYEYLFKERVEEKRLFVDDINETEYYVHINKKNLIKQLDSLAKHALKEEGFIYVPVIQTVFEYGFFETPNEVRTSKETFLELAEIFDVIELYHYHPYHTDKSVMQKTPSKYDLLAYFKNVVEGYLLNENSSITSHHSSAYGLTSYKVKSNNQLSSAIRIAYENEEESKKHLEALEDNVEYFFEKNCYIYKAKRKSHKKKKKNRIDFSAEGGKEFDSFYIQFIPTNASGELLWK